MPFFLKTSNATTFGTAPFGLCGFDIIQTAAIYSIKGLASFDFEPFSSRRFLLVTYKVPNATELIYYFVIMFTLLWRQGELL
jgi:hypothetical protein